MVEHHVYPVTADRSPVTPEECLGWFDSDGRLVKEAVMRQRLFEGEGRREEGGRKGGREGGREGGRQSEKTGEGRREEYNK